MGASLESYDTDAMLEGDPVKVFLVDDSAMFRERVVASLCARAIKIVGQAATPKESIEGILAGQKPPRTTEFDGSRERR